MTTTLTKADGFQNNSLMINLHNVTKSYSQEHIALRGIELKVNVGSFLFVAGASGAGKSTLLRILFGAEQASTGQVVVGGRNLSALQVDLKQRMSIPYLRREMGFIFQDYKLLPRRTVLDNVAFGLEVMGVGQVDRRDLAASLLSSLGLGDKLKAFPETLSGGEQQRVAIARALIHKPRLLLADEPTGNLDRAMTHSIFELLLEANAAGVTIVVATHNLAIIEELNLRTIVLDRGKIIGDFENPRGIQ